MPKLDPGTLLYAYSQGYFPMGDPDDGEVYWYDPDPRAVIPVDGFHVPKRLERTLRQGRFEVRFDTAFREVIAGCAAPTPSRASTWITPEVLGAYTELHRLGFAHSAEAWREGRLVGGVYGVSLRGLFAGESMFSRERDSSKAALIFLLRHLRARGYSLFDVQFMNPHLRQFGAMELPQRVYKAKLAAALARPVTFGEVASG